jgi:hypothetical protein
MKKYIMNSFGAVREVEEDNELTIRDYFAAKIAPQMNWEGTYAKEWEKEASDNLRAKRVYEIADALIKARENI